MRSKSMSRRLEAQGVKEDFPKFQSLHMTHREKAPDVLRGIIKKHFYIDALGDEYVIEDKGNHALITKDENTLFVPLYALGEVIKALTLFG